MAFWEGFRELGWAEIARKQSKYQSIQILESVDRRINLVLDGMEQFNSGDQYRYHECLGILPYMFNPYAKDILILGGGDVLLAEHLLRLPIQSITIVDIDPEVIEISKEYLNELNKGSLKDKRVKIVNEDAWDYVNNCKKKYDLVLCDYTDAFFLPCARLYSIEHLRAIKKILTKEGIVAMQLITPSIHPEAFWSMVFSFKVSFPGYVVLPYHVYMPYMKCDAAFCLATPNKNRMAKMPCETEFLSEDIISSLFVFAKDEQIKAPVIPSTAQNLMYAKYMMRRRVHYLKNNRVIYEDSGNNERRI